MMSKKEIWNLGRIIAAAALLVPILVLEYAVEARWAAIAVLAASIAAYLLVGYDVIIKAFRRIIHGQFLEESFLMTIASVGAFAIGEYPEAVAVMLFFQVGEFFEHRAVKRSRKSIKALLSINPDVACVLRDGAENIVPCEQVAIGDIVLVKPGERVPLDGVVVAGDSQIDMSSLNGESVPRSVQKGGEVMSGAVNLTGAITIEVTKLYGESTASKMIALVEKAREQKAPVENFITTFAKYYTPSVVAIALVVGVVVPLCVQYNDWPTWSFWIKKALVFLVVSCPCALVISVPLSYFGAIGLAGRLGILVKGGHIFAAITKADVVAMDKTGTITEGRFAVCDVYPADRRRQILSLAYLAEKDSNHPIAKSVCKYAALECDLPKEDYEIREIRGKGMIASRADTRILVGNASLLDEYGLQALSVESVGTILYVAKDSEVLGYIRIEDSVKPNSGEAISQLLAQGIMPIMLSGDSNAVAASVARTVGIEQFAAELLPEDKVAKVSELMREHTVAFVGDGINDAPVIATADVGIAMGGIGQDAAIESADVVLMQDDLGQINKLRQVAVKTQRIVKENIVFALAVKLAVMALSFTSLSAKAAMMWLAVAADVGVALLAILNAMRAGRAK